MIKDDLKNNFSPALYVHVPFCSSKCYYCDFFSIPVKKISDSYVECLLKEAFFRARLFNVSSWSSVYIGGGTPGLLSPDQISRLLKGLKKICPLEKDSEVTLEMNPQSLSPEKLYSALESGVNRLSLGVQSLDDRALKAVGRLCNSKTALKALEDVKKIWKGELNLDVMAGLPYSDDRSFMESLEKIAFLSPDHISLYSLTVEEGTPLALKIKKGLEWNEDDCDRQWILGRDFLEKNGISQYEVSNFARPGHEGKHNISYWKQNDYLGIGSGGCGTVYFSGIKGIEGAVRWTGEKNIEDWTSFWSSFSFSQKKLSQGLERLISSKNEEDAENAFSFLGLLPGVQTLEWLDSKTLEFEYLMTGLRTLDGISSADYKKRYSSLYPWFGSLEKRLGYENGPWALQRKEGLTNEEKRIKSSFYALNAEGLLFLNSLLSSYI